MFPAITCIPMVLLQGESIDIDESITTLTIKAPSIAAFGETCDLLTDIKVVIEETVFVMPSMAIAIHFCFASYYVCNISFPSEFRFVLFFLEKFIYNFKTSASKLPLSVVTFNDNLRRVCDD